MRYATVSKVIVETLEQHGELDIETLHKKVYGAVDGNGDATLRQVAAKNDPYNTLRALLCQLAKGKIKSLKNYRLITRRVPTEDKTDRRVVYRIERRQQ